MTECQIHTAVAALIPFWWLNLSPPGKLLERTTAEIERRNVETPWRGGATPSRPDEGCVTRASGSLAYPGANGIQLTRCSTKVIKGLGSVDGMVTKTVPTLDNGVGFAKNGSSLSDTPKAVIAPNTGKYSNLPEPRNVGEGKDFTPATKRKILEQNKQNNGGVIKSDQSGLEAVPSVKNKSGVTPPSNEAQIDHVIPKSQGGTNSPSNAQVLTRKENRLKSDK